MCERMRRAFRKTLLSMVSATKEAALKPALGVKMIEDDRLGRALSLMKDALLLLDEAEAAPDVGAHLDLAIHRLEDALGSQSVVLGDRRAANQ